MPARCTLTRDWHHAFGLVTGEAYMLTSSGATFLPRSVEVNYVRTHGDISDGRMWSACVPFVKGINALGVPVLVCVIDSEPWPAWLIEFVEVNRPPEPGREPS